MSVERVSSPAVQQKRERLWERIRNRFRHDRRRLEVHIRWSLQRSPRRAHGLDRPLVVSLTSHPPRFGTLALTLKCLLRQSVRPDLLVLWVAHGDRDHLPASVTCLVRSGLTIEYCDDLRSFTKVIPALDRYPDAYIVTADDDTWYWSTWLQELVDAHSARERAVVCHRIHRIRLQEDGLPKPYRQWELDTADSGASSLNFLTGVGGVLYPPGVIPGIATRRDLFSVLCPANDDIWLFWMTRLHGVPIRKVGPVRKWTSWRGSQHVALWQTNRAENDLQIRNMVDHFGFPPGSRKR